MNTKDEATNAARSCRGRPMSAKLEALQVELVHLQDWVVREGAKVCIVFEGRDGAGKGGVIKRITERVNSSVFRVVALSAPTDREKSQMYVQRYMPHFPAAGEVVIFDRSWYNRAGVERVMGFCSEERGPTVPRAWCRPSEQAMVDSGSSCSSTGSKSARRSRPAGSKARIATAVRSGSSRPWTSSSTPL